jgi:hypothetical protein
MFGSGYRAGWRGSALLAAFALLAFSVRALLPAGMMLAPERGLIVAIKLCTADGYVDALVDTGTGKVVHGDRAPDNDGKSTGGAGKHPPCAFAATPAMVGPATAAEPTAVAFDVTTLVFAPGAAPSPGRGLAAPPPWSTGPPNIV